MVTLQVRIRSCLPTFLSRYCILRMILWENITLIVGSSLSEYIVLLSQKSLNLLVILGNEHSLVNITCLSNLIVPNWWLDSHICHSIVYKTGCLTYIIAVDPAKILIITESWFHAPSSMPHPLWHLWCIHHRPKTSINNIILNGNITLKHPWLDVCFWLIMQSTLFHCCQLTMRAKNLTI